MVIGDQLEIHLRLSFLFKDFFVCMDGHPQATVVLFPCSHVTHGFMEATMGIRVCLLVCLFTCLFVCLFVCLLVCLFACLFVCLFVCLLVCLFAWSTERRKRGECCIYGLSP